MPFLSLAELKQRLGVLSDTDDPLLETLQTAAEDFIEAYCDRQFRGGSYTELHCAGARVLFLQQRPVQDLISVRLDPLGLFPDESELPPTRYRVDRQRGTVTSTMGPFRRADRQRPPRPDDYPGQLQVRYTTPMASIPTPVTRATLELVNHWYRAIKTGNAMNHQNWVIRREGDTETHYPYRQSTGYTIPEVVLRLLQHYRVPTV